MNPRRRECPAKSPTTPAAAAQRLRKIRATSVGAQPLFRQLPAQIEGPKDRRRGPERLQPSLERSDGAQIRLGAARRGHVQLATRLARIVLAIAATNRSNAVAGLGGVSFSHHPILPREAPPGSNVSGRLRSTRATATYR
jgi:hypothetical protein